MEIGCARSGDRGGALGIEYRKYGGVTAPGETARSALHACRIAGAALAFVGVMDPALDDPDPPRDPGDLPDCGDDRHPEIARTDIADAEVEWAVRLFKALGDEGRLRLLLLLRAGEACVSELAQTLDEPLSSISTRLRILRTDGLVRQRRDGKHIYYRLEDGHVAAMVENAIDHARHL